jgi:hypothetical protein
MLTFPMVAGGEEKLALTMISASMCIVAISMVTGDGKISIFSWRWSPWLGADCITGAAATEGGAGGDGVGEAAMASTTRA